MKSGRTTAQSESGALSRVLLKRAEDAFGAPGAIEREWRGLNFTAPPDFSRAVAEYDEFVAAIAASGTQIDYLPPGVGVGLDSIYVRDATVASDAGMILCRMAKAQRAAEPAAQADALRAAGVPIAGSIQPPGQLEGGDAVWLVPRVLAVGRGYRTNADGIRQLRALLGGAIDELIEVPLPHWRGPADVFHLMSIVSPVAADLAVVYSPLLPVPFRERLLDLGYAFVEVPDEEFESMGTNVLAVAPRQCVMVAGNPQTRTRLERAGARIVEYAGREISLKGGGGPTCLTRPILRRVQS